MGKVIVLAMGMLSAAYGRELNGRFIWTGNHDVDGDRKSAVYPCSKYLEIEAPLEREEAHRFEKLVEYAIHPSASFFFIHNIFKDIKRRDYTKPFIKHPLYPIYLKRMLEHVMENPELELPYNIDVKTAYEFYLAHQRDLVLLGMYHQKAAVCQAAADAAGYFMDRTAFGLVELFDGYLDYFKCDNAYHSWHRQARDNRKG